MADVLGPSELVIAEVCDEIKILLMEKNRKYGDSALNPSRIFSKSDAVEQIKVRIDDKLTRLKNQQGDEDEDVVQDLIGYLVLLRVAQRKLRNQKSNITVQASGMITSPTVFINGDFSRLIDKLPPDVGLQ
jgi:hypothetical protein